MRELNAYERKEEERRKVIEKNIEMFFIFFVILILSVIVVEIMNNKMKIKVNKDNMKYYTAKVISVKEKSTKKENDTNIIIEEPNVFTARITSKEKYNEIVTAEQHIEKTLKQQIRDVKKGDKVILVASSYQNLKTTENSENTENKTNNEETVQFYFAEYDKTLKTSILVFIFGGLILFIGKWKGVGTIFGIVLAGYAIVRAYIPSILFGVNIYLSTIILLIYVIISSLLLINGFEKKTLSAIIGNIVGVVTCGILTFCMNKIFLISGIVDDQSVYLLTTSDVSINLVAVVWAGILIGSLGAVMDVAMSISSTIREISLNAKDKNFNTLFSSGMAVGKDIIGTMTNTLILAYVGGSLSTTILLAKNTKNFMYLINMEFFIVEILQAILGTIGILITVPITAFVASVFEMLESENVRKYNG